MAESGSVRCPNHSRKEMCFHVGRVVVGKTTTPIIVLLLLLVTVSCGAAIKGVSGLPHKLEKSKNIQNDESLSSQDSTSHQRHSLELRIKDDNHQEPPEVQAQAPYGTIKEEVFNDGIRHEVLHGNYNNSYSNDTNNHIKKSRRESNITRRSPIKNSCSIKSVPDTHRQQTVLTSNPLLHYTSIAESHYYSSRNTKSSSEIDNLFGREPPEGCDFMKRYTDSILCTGDNMTSIPDFGHIRDVNILHFSRTAIQKVINLDSVPRTIKALYFTNGFLVAFDGRELAKIQDLELLSLDNNVIDRFSFVSIFHVQNPANDISISFLSIQNNLITYPPDPSGRNETVLPNLEILVMNGNPMCFLPGKLFKPLRNSPITELYLRNCSIGEFYGSPLEYFPHLEILDLSNNNGLSPEELETLFLPLKGRNLRELYLSNNNYGSVPTAALTLVNNSLDVLDLHGSAFECLDNSSFPQMEHLTRLNLMYCRIMTIRDHTFHRFPALQELNLDGNGLTTVPSEALLPTLTILTMSENPRNTGSEVPQEFTIDNVNFRKMQNLINLTFDHVPICQVRKAYFNDLYNLKKLYLSYSKISYIEPLSFQNLTKLEKLFLNDNNLEILYNDTFKGLSSLIFLDLSRNQIIFQSYLPKSFQQSVVSRFQVVLSLPDRVVRWARESFFRHESDKSEIERVAEKDQSTSPLQSSNQIERMSGDLDPEESTACEGSEKKKSGYEGTEIPGETRGYRVQPLIYRPFEGLINLQCLNLSYNQISFLFPELIENQTNLRTLKLDFNKIENWDKPIFSKLQNLTQLSLRKNSLTELTEAMVVDFQMENLVEIDLRANTFSCNCMLSNFNETLNASHFVDYSLYRCQDEGNEFYSLTDYIANATCDEKENNPEEELEGFNINIIIISASLLLSLVTSATVYKKRWYMRYAVYSLRMRFQVQKEDTDKYTYDTFVSYSQSDRQWVFEYLLPKLENVGRYRVCVHERDFTVGQEITENIIISVEKSRKVIVVLTPSFVASSWCMFELQMASNKILDERKSKLILLVLETIPEDQQPKKLKLLLKTRTYVEWMVDKEGQKLFWAKLLRAISKPSESEAMSTITRL